MSARRETIPRVTFSQAGVQTTAAGGPAEAGMSGGAWPRQLGSTNQWRLLLFILIPTVSLLTLSLLLGLVLTGFFRSPLPTHQPFASNHLGYYGNGTRIPFSFPSPTASPTPFQSELETAPPSPGSSFQQVTPTSQAPPTSRPTTQPPDWLSSVTSLPGLQSISTSTAPDTACQLITEPQCHMLPYNHTWLSSSVAVVRSSEVDMLLRFFSYLSRLSCYTHIMLFGCSLALPECVSADGVHDRRAVLPCSSFCEAAREGCEPVLQMFNASWPEFLRCSQFNDTATPPPSPSSPSPSSPPPSPHSPHPPVCYTPTQIKGKSSVCGGRDFLCAGGLCVPQKLVCNGFNDCDDWSDEKQCVCADAEFRCNTGRCLSPSLVCDGYDDCGDLSDELNCVCDASREHRCGDGRCVSTDWLCDGDHDCVDKSDELNCSCRSQGLLECRNGQCIPSAFRCDGEDDCKDGSDEEQCTGQTQGVCSPGQSSCGGGTSTCIPRNCTGCEPISLELCLNLPYNLTSSPNFLGHQSQRESAVSWEASLFPALVQTGCYQFLMFYACTLLVPKCDPRTLKRVPPCRSVCRSARDQCELVLGLVGLQWPDESDCSRFPESECLLPEDGVDECSPSHFRCRSGRCVLATKRCDGQPDCDDRSDEERCGCAERSLWQCPNSSVCIRSSLICDGFPDCPLLEDEANCSVCRDNEVSCNNHQCVHRTLWCDGRKHCSDSSDEWDCVSLSDSSVLTVFRTASQYRVCADEWNHELSSLTCKQLGLGVPSSVAMVTEQPDSLGRRRWLHVHPEWRERNGTALQARLEKRSHACHSRRSVSLSCSTDDCGLRPAVGVARQRKRRILGGVVSRQGAWPWQCSLQSGPSGHVCGCVLIGRRWVLTVAHCFEGREGPELWTVVLGLLNLDHPGLHSQSRRVRTIILHPRYNRAVVDYDISVVQLDSEVEETPYVRPVCLPRPSQLPTPDSYCYITGWGHTGSRMPFKLQQGPVRIVSRSQCQSYFDSKTITPRMLCAGFHAGTVDSCMGDSGGPLVCQGPGGSWTLFGLTSWGSVCFSKVLGPGVYSNVVHFRTWIQQQVYLYTYLIH